MAKITLEYLGVEGTGKTVKEAKLEATRKIEKLLKADRSPHFLSFRGESIIVWHTGASYVYKMLDNAADYSRGQKIQWGTQPLSDDIREVLAECRRHLAQICWDGVEDMSPLLTEAKEQQQFTQWVRFQRAYQEARIQGKSETDCHQYACENSYA